MSLHFVSTYYCSFLLICLPGSGLSSRDGIFVCVTLDPLVVAQSSVFVTHGFLLLPLEDLVAMWHVSSSARDIPSTGRWIPNRWTARDVQGGLVLTLLLQAMKTKLRGAFVKVQGSPRSNLTTS